MSTPPITPPPIDPASPALPVSDGTLQRIRQLLRPDFALLVAKSARVFRNGVAPAQPIIASGVNTVTSTGVTGVYALNFAPVVFTVAPVVTVWSSLESVGGNLVICNLQAVTTTLFQFWMATAATGAVAALPAGHTVSLAWIAVGS